MISMPAPPPYRHRRRLIFDYLVMTPADADALSAELKAAYPTIKFVPDEYWRPYFDATLWKAETRAQDLARERGKPIPPRRYVPEIPVGKPVPYVESLGDLSHSRFEAWIEPPGWKPHWEGPSMCGNPYLTNYPPLCIQFWRGTFAMRSNLPKTMSAHSNAEPVPPDHDRIVELSMYGHLFGDWHLDSPEEKAFLKTVERIVYRITKVGIYRIDQEVLRPLAAPESWPGMERDKVYRYGHDAERWALARRHNYFWQVQHLYKPFAYPYAKAEFIDEDNLPEGERTRRANAERAKQEYEAKLAALDAETARNRAQRQAAKAAKAEAAATAMRRQKSRGVPP
jgi:hypothetical protein